jgi:murein L,D-transpeptidase YcbB/YkuD
MLATMRKLMISMVLVVVMPVTAQVVEVLPATAAARQIKTAIDDSNLGARRADVRSFYAAAGYRAAWSRNGQRTAQARVILTALGTAAEKGLDPADYVLTLATDEAHFDVALTAAAMHYAADLHSGRVDPRGLGFDLDVAARRLYLPALMTSLSLSNDPTALLAAVEPQNANYRGLLAALTTYRRIAAQSEGEQPLPVVEKVKPGEAYAATVQLAMMLRRTGDLAECGTGSQPVRGCEAAAFGGGRVENPSHIYDGAMIDAVKKFQSRHGLGADGVISRKTFAELNVPASRRVQQIEWAIERSRWTSTDGASIVVNIPEFRLRATDVNGVMLAMNVVVGKAAGHKTPVLEGDIRNVVFRPTWSVPDDIQRKEIAPKLQRDANWLANHNFEIIDDSGNSLGSAVDAATLEQIRTLRLRVRQKPGTSNALGLVKFLFPNDNDVYLHSTPEQSLFARTRRDFSHGCVRVADPVALAAWTLHQPADKVRAAISGNADDQYNRPDRPVHVMIVYSTAAAGEDGSVHFFADIYGLDATLAAALSNVHPTPAGGVLVAAK